MEKEFVKALELAQERVLVLQKELAKELALVQALVSQLVVQAKVQVLELEKESELAQESVLETGWVQQELELDLAEPKVQESESPKAQELGLGKDWHLLQFESHQWGQA